MSEVETTEAVESQPVPVEEQSASPTEAEPSWQDQLRAEKARVAGKDRALTETKQELARIRSEAEALAAWKAEKEKADMTEVERLQAQVAQYEQAIAAANAVAQRATLKAEFPQSFSLLGDNAPLDPGTLAILEARLSAEREANEPSPRVDPNNPRRATSYVTQPTNPSIEDSLGVLKKLGNPFRDDAASVGDFTANVRSQVADR